MAKNIAESNTPRGKDLLLVRNNVRHVCLVDLDNASNFFELCDNGRTSIIPEGTFIWCFCGCNTQLSRAIGKSLTFYTLLMKQFVEIDHTPFNRGDAASIALAMTAGQLHQELPMYIPFTILTSEAAFSEVRPRLVGRHVCHTRAKTTLQMKEALHQSFSSDLLEGNCSPSSPRIESVTQEHVNFTSKQRHSDVQIEPVGSITNVPRMVPHSVKETQPIANHQLNAAPQQKQLSHRTYQSIRTSIPSSSLTTSTQVHQENIPQPYVSHMTPRPQEKSHCSNESVEKAEQKTHSVDPTPANDSSSKFAAGVGSEKVYRKYRSPWEQSDLLKSEPKPKIVQCLIPRTQPNVVHTQVLTNSAQISHGSQLNAPKIEDTNFPFSGEIPVSAPVSCTQVKNFMTTTPHAVPKRPRLLDF